METGTDLETKYQKLASEYSKIRSQATVLKKAVLDEQAKNVDLKESLKKQEQQIRKHVQEMDSLTFRNEQLTKRITVLQDELKINVQTKKGNKTKGGNETVLQSDMTILDEELHKKILENAQLASSMVDKDFELNDYKDQIKILENKLASLEKEHQEKESKLSREIEELKLLKDNLEEKKVSNSLQHNINSDQIQYWKEQAERWKAECDLLRSRPESDEQLSEYYEKQLGQMFDAKQMAQSECRSLSAENQALSARLENAILENKQLRSNLDKSIEELTITSENYKSQLDALTEHLASQNEKITKQCDEIEILKHCKTTRN